jgi:hypothetical protein
MEKVTRVLGLVHGRNEWPLLGLSVQHALENHCEVVAVLDHGSTDGTAFGLAKMKDTWRERLVLFRSDDSSFFQEALYELLLDALRPEERDWIFTFDADEFFVTGAGGLPRLLHDTPLDAEVVLTSVLNYVAPTDFDPANMRDYLRLQHRAVPTIACDSNDLGPDAVIDAIIEGRQNYFDHEFQPKVIARYHAGLHLRAGSHRVASVSPPAIRIGPERGYRAHLPLLSLGRLELRTYQSKEYDRIGLPVDHGWQSRLIHRAHMKGELEPLWHRHSISAQASTPGSSAKNGIGYPNFVIDDSLSNSLVRTVAACKTRASSSPHGSGVENIDSAPASITGLPYLGWVHKRMQETLETQNSLTLLRNEAASLRNEAASLRHEREAILSSRSWRATRLVVRVARAVRGLLPRRPHWRWKRGGAES